VPTLLTAGTKDIFTPQHFTKSIAQEIPHAELILFEGSGHTHHWDRLEQFNRRTLDFLMKENFT
jgi:pimeloyl-ACP methyl ester carboxylesterase